MMHHRFSQRYENCFHHC